MKADQPLVTYAIAAYNHADYVQQAIQSIADQTYPNIELIIVDDGSTDATFNKIVAMEQACKQRFTRYTAYTRANRGLVATLNEMLEWAEGEYFACLASDDQLLPCKVEEQVGYLERNPHCPAVFANADLIDDKGLITKRPPRPARNYGFEDVFHHQHYLPALTQLIRRQHLTAVGGYNPEHRIEDWSMWLALTRSGAECHCLAAVHGLYRQHPMNMSKQFGFMHKERLNIAAHYRNHPGYKRAVAECYRRSADELLPVSRRAACRYYIGAVKRAPAIVFSRSFLNGVAKLIK